jgi:hypothetical protein
VSISKNGVNITSLREWKSLAPPKSAKHWVDGRSAKESARAWLEGNGINLPFEVHSALAQPVEFGQVRQWDAEPEARLPFDSLGGEPRNSDLAVFAHDEQGRQFLIAVEAKADEPFAATIAQTLAAGVERHVVNDRSNGVVRVQQLVTALLGPRAKGDPAIQGLRYQLLTACAGALCEAERRGYQRALLLIHEFISDVTADEYHERNTRDLNTFVKRLSHGTVSKIAVGEIAGPFVVPGSPLFGSKVQLFIGKVTRNIRTINSSNATPKSNAELNRCGPAH